MRKVMIIGCEAEELKVAIENCFAQNEVVILKSIEINNKQFAPEPIVIHNYRELEQKEYYEAEPSKFIAKPKYNFKKR